MLQLNYDKKKTKKNEPSLQWTYLKGEPSIHSQPLSVTESWPPIHRAVPVGACFITPGRQQHRISFRRVWGQLLKKYKDKPRPLLGVADAIQVWDGIRGNMTTQQGSDTHSFFCLSQWPLNYITRAQMQSHNTDGCIIKARRGLCTLYEGLLEGFGDAGQVSTLVGAVGSGLRPRPY